MLASDTQHLSILTTNRTTIKKKTDNAICKICISIRNFTLPLSANMKILCKLLDGVNTTQHLKTQKYHALLEAQTISYSQGYNHTSLIYDHYISNQLYFLLGS